MPEIRHMLLQFGVCREGLLAVGAAMRQCSVHGEMLVQNPGVGKHLIAVRARQHLGAVGIVQMSVLVAFQNIQRREHLATKHAFEDIVL